MKSVRLQRRDYRINIVFILIAFDYQERLSFSVLQLRGYWHSFSRIYLLKTQIRDYIFVDQIDFVKNEQLKRLCVQDKLAVAAPDVRKPLADCLLMHHHHASVLAYRLPTSIWRGLRYHSNIFWRDCSHFVWNVPDEDARISVLCHCVRFHIKNNWELQAFSISFQIALHIQC